MKLIPYADFILVKPLDDKPKSEFIIIESKKKRSSLGRVLAVGSGKRTPDGIIPNDVKVGQKIVFNRHTPYDTKAGNYLVAMADVLAIIEKP